MIKWILGSVCCVVIALQTGCTTYGVSDEVWLQMTPEQQQITISDYRARQQVYADQRLERQEAARLAQEQAARLQEERRRQQALANQCIEVEIGGGHIFHHGQYLRYTPQIIQLRFLESKQIQLRLADNSTVACYVQYAKGALLFDAPIRPNDPHRCIPISESAQWKTGFNVPPFNMGPENSFRARDLEVTVRHIPSAKPHH